MSGVNPPASITRRCWGAPSASDQSKTLPDPGRLRVDQCDIGAVVVELIESRVAGDERLDDEGHVLADPQCVGRRLVAVQLRALETRLVHEIDDALRRLVAEHADGQHLGRQPAHDVAGPHRLQLADRRREDEPDRIRAERDRQQRVVLVGDATDLHEHGVSDPTSRRCRRHAQVFHRGRGIARLDQGLAHQQRVIARGGQCRRVVGAADAGFGDAHHARRHERRHPPSPGLVDLEGDEVALVDADQIGLDSQRPLELGLVVDLDEHVEADLAGQLMEVGELGVVERGGDQQHAIGAHEAGVAHVAGVDGEVLAQHRPSTGGARRRADRPRSLRRTRCR